MKILLPVDGSLFTKKMLEHVIATPEMFGKAHEYMLLTVITPLLPQGAGMLGKTAVDEYYHETASEVLEPALKVMQDGGLTVQSGYKVGYVGDALPEEAIAGEYGLIVMGSRGHGTLGSLVLGSVANAILSKTKIPVLLIR